MIKYTENAIMNTRLIEQVENKKYEIYTRSNMNDFESHEILNSKYSYKEAQDMILSIFDYNIEL